MKPYAISYLWIVTALLAIPKEIPVKHDLPGQGILILHCVVSVPTPSQGLPPPAGAGFVHVLFLLATPPAQVEEHTDHSDQAAQNPSTTRSMQR